MNKKHRLIIRRVCGLLLAAALLCAFALPAWAAEGDMDTQVEPGGGENDPGGEGPVDPDPGVDPTPGVDDPTPPPADDPTPPPTDDPTPPPTDDPTPPPSDDPDATPGPDDPTPPPDGGEETPTPEPTEEPPVYVDPGTNNNNNAGGTANSGSSGPRNPGGTIAQPSFSPRSTPPPIQSSSSQEEDPADKEPRWITFARVTQRTNSMSRVLFYSGASCIGAGALGLLVLMVFIIRNRHIDARNDRIFEEIAQAETRQQPSPAGRSRQQEDTGEVEYGYEGYDSSYDGYGPEGGGPGGQDAWEQDAGDERACFRQSPQGYDVPPPRVDRPEPESLTVPVNGSLYTEEFEIPRQARYVPPQEPVQPAPPVQPVRPPQAPPMASMYTEEFSLPDEMAQPAPPRPRPVQAPQSVQPSRPAQPPRPAQPSQPAVYDTTELLREILHSEDGNR